MSQIRSLVWKEWREARAFLWIGLGVFLGLPVIGGLEAMTQSSHRFEITTAMWVIPFAGVLAVFAAVGATCRDFAGRLEEFWHAQPVGVVQRLLVKYLVGLAIVLLVCILPLLIEWAVNRKTDPGLLQLAAWLPFTWTAIYSLGFAAGCLLRRTAHAGMLALSAMLLLYFLPIVLPPLEWLNVEPIANNLYSNSSPPQRMKFAAGMLGIAVFSLVLAIAAVRRHWHVESGRKMMYGAVSAAILIVFASAGFRLGTNLPILQQIDLASDESGAFFHVEGERGALITMRSFNRTSNKAVSWSDIWKSRRLEIGNTKVGLGEPENTAEYFQFEATRAVSNPHNPGITYSALEYVQSDKDVCFLYQRTNWISPLVMPRKLWEYDQTGKSYGKRVALCVWQNHLYVMGTRMARIDLDHADQEPEFLEAPFPYTLDEPLFGGDSVIVHLPPVPQLPPRQRLEALLNQNDQALQNNLLCIAQGDTLLAYRLANLTEKSATFEKTGQYEHSLLERVFGTYRYSGIKLQNDLLFVTGAPAMQMFNPHVTVFDARAGERLRPVGHFAAPGATMIACPLPDGRTLVAGSKLWVVGPPVLRKRG